jgi:hypothetical protein
MLGLLLCCLYHFKLARLGEKLYSLSLFLTVFAFKWSLAGLGWQLWLLRLLRLDLLRLLLILDDEGLDHRLLEPACRALLDLYLGADLLIVEVVLGGLMFPGEEVGDQLEILDRFVGHQITNAIRTVGCITINL